jgi:2-amino-4-hydroxy-6-hydroxymethyldihydropteridine diphosphokinase
VTTARLAAATAAYVALGTNLGDRVAALEGAVAALDGVPGVRVEGVSPVYEAEAHTRPGQVPQPDYLNAVAHLSTTLDAPDLLQVLLEVERRSGRVRRAGEAWAARPLDLDLLLYGGQVLDLPGLVVPHPRLAERRFVLQPLADLAPGLPVPGAGATVAELLARCPDQARLTPTVHWLRSVRKF